MIKILKYGLRLLLGAAVISCALLFSGTPVRAAESGAHWDAPADGGWRYIDPDGNPRTGWIQTDGKWYYADQTGKIKQRSWVLSNGTYYFMDYDGSMVTGQWLLDSAGVYYYLDDNGQMAAGWRKINGAWYFFSGSGAMYSSTWVWIGNAWYYFNGSGAMVSNQWMWDGAHWYFLNPDGSCRTGWMQRKGVWYYLLPSGAAVCNDVWKDPATGICYYFDGNGSMVTTAGWIPTNLGWIYAYSDGSLADQWEMINGKWYWFKDGVMSSATGWVAIGSSWYYFWGDGSMATGTVTDSTGTTYQIPADGAVADPMLLKAQSYSSRTGNLILVNRSTHKVSVFSGSQGNWQQIRSFSCTDGNATPNGTFTIGSHTLYFGNEKGYTCWYATQITGDILFHSVLYNVGSQTSIQDGRLGIRVSHGCIRLNISDAEYIYKNIPSGTTVVLY